MCRPIQRAFYFNASWHCTGIAVSQFAVGAQLSLELIAEALAI